MSARTILWVDLRSTRSDPDLCSSLPRDYSATRLRDTGRVLQTVQHSQPWAVCFEYDVPDARGLAALLEVKTRHSSLPIIMLTEKRGSTLETLAFRHCVSEYLVKPTSVSRLCDSLRNLGGAAASDDDRTALGPAISYVTSNYSEKLQLSTAARLCDMSRFQFSRNFKKERGLTFRDFVVQTRIHRAAELMRESALSVTEAAFVVGFNDLSYFSRVFRRRLGVSPSQYRRSESEPSQLPLFPTDQLRKR